MSVASIVPSVEGASSCSPRLFFRSAPVTFKVGPPVPSLDEVDDQVEPVEQGFAVGAVGSRFGDPVEPTDD